MADPNVPEGARDAELLNALTQEELDQIRRQNILDALNEELAAQGATEAGFTPQSLTPEEKQVLEEGIDPLTAARRERAALISARKKLQPEGQLGQREGRSFMSDNPVASAVQTVADMAINQIPGGRVIQQGLEESLYQTGRSIVGVADAATGMFGVQPMTSPDDSRDKIPQDGMSEAASGIVGYMSSFALNALVLKKLGVSNTLVRGFGAGAVTDAFQVDPYAAGIGDLMEQYVPGADKSEWVDWFTSGNKADDSVWEARSKSLLEGMVIGGAVELTVKAGSLLWKSITKLRDAEQAVQKGDEKAAEQLTEEAVQAADELSEVTGQPRFDPKKGVYDAGWWRNKDILPKDSGDPYDITYRAMSGKSVFGDALPTRDGQFDYSPVQSDRALAGDVGLSASAPLDELLDPGQIARMARSAREFADTAGISVQEAEALLREGQGKAVERIGAGEIPVISKEGGTPVTSANVRMAPIDQNPSRLGKPVKPAPFSNPIYDMTEGVAERAAKAKAAREAGASAGGTGTRGARAAGEVVEGTPVSGAPVKVSKNTVAVQMQSKEATESFIKNMGRDYDTSLEAFGRAFNASKIQTTEDAHAVIGQAAKVLQDEGVKIEWKTTYAEIKEMALQLAVDETKLLHGLKVLAGNTDNFAEIVTASRYMLATLGDQMVDIGKQMTNLKMRGESTATAEEAFRNKLALMETIIPDLKLIRWRAAVATSSGNIPAFSLKTAQEVVNKVRMVDGDMVTAAMLMGRMTRSDAVKVARRALLGGSYWDALIQWRTNALLAGPKTMATNVLGTGLWGLTKPAARVVGAMMTGNGQNVKSQARLFVGAWSAWRDAARYMKQAGVTNKSILDPAQGTYEMHGRAFENLARQYFETGKTADAGTLAMTYLDTVSTLPSRLLNTQDEFFKQMAYRSFMHQKAMGVVDLRIANGTLKEADRAAAVKKIIDDSFDPRTGAGIDDEALQYAREATFTQDVGPWAQSFQIFANAVPPLRFIFPFIRTPTNLLSEAWQLTPGLNFASNRFRKALFSNDPNQRAEALGKLAFGVTGAAMAYWAAAAGAINGRLPSDPQARARFLEDQRLPYSFWDPNQERWVQFNRMDPYAAFLGIAADASMAAQEYDGFDEDGIFVGTALMLANGLGAVPMSLSDTLKGKSYFSSVTDALNIVGWGQGDDDQRMNTATRTAGRFISSFIPNLTSQLSAEDNVAEMRNLMDASINKLNVMGFDWLPPKRDALGIPVMRSSGWMFGEVPNWASPFTMGMKVDSPVRAALLEAQATISKPNKMLAEGVDLLKFKNERGQDAYDRLQEINSEIKLGDMTLLQRLESRLPYWKSTYGDLSPRQSPDNPDVTESPIKKEIQEIISDYREASRNKLLQEFPEIARAVESSRRFNATAGNPLNQLRN